MRIFLGACIAIALVGVSSVARAAPDDVRSILDLYEKPDTGQRGVIEMGMNSTQLGILATNLYVAQTLGVSIYCQPDGLALNGNQLISMLRAAIKERPQIGNLPAGPALLFVLMQTFPCPKISK